MKMAKLMTILSLFWGAWSWAQHVTIVDPVGGSYVSGNYAILLETDVADKVAQTRVFLDQSLVEELPGWQAEMVISFGDGTRSYEIQVELDLVDGQTIRSPMVRTKALKVDYVETSRAILISTVVKNRKRQHLTDLDRSQFQVFEDGKALKIQSFDYENLPLDLVMVLDTSSSLREGIVDLKRAAAAFLKQLSATDLVALLEIKNKPRKIQDFTNDQKLLMGHIEAMESLGQTALFDTVELGLAAFPEKRRGRRTIILFTDGRDSVYEEPYFKAKLLRNIITQAQNNEVTLFAVGLGKRINAPALERMAEDTGGRFIFAENPQRLPAAFGEIILDLKHQYVLGVLPESRRKGFHELDVRVAKRGAKVFARKGYTTK